MLQYTTLSILGYRGELSNAQLARRAYMSPQAMSEVIEALERKGLIERAPRPGHRRVLPAVLTAKGRKVLRACDAAVDELEAEMLRGLGRRDRASLRAQAMSEVIEALEGKGLIERAPRPGHRRVLPAVLTAKGRKVLRACDAAVDELEAEMLRGLGRRDRASLRAGLVSAVRALGAGLPER